MTPPIGESLLLFLIATTIVVAAVREVVMFARWISGSRKIRDDH
jgi:hypothetical protein